MQCLLGRWFYEFHCFGRLAHTSSKSTIKKTPANDTIINYKTDRRALFFKLIKKKFPCDFFFRPLFFFPPCLPLSIFGRKLMAEKNRSSSQDIPTHCVVVVAPNPLECIPESSTRPAYCRIRRWSVSRSMCTTRKKNCFSSWERNILSRMFFIFAFHSCLSAPTSSERLRQKFELSYETLHTWWGWKSAKVKIGRKVDEKMF